MEIMLTLAASSLVTHSSAPSGVIAKRRGRLPTWMFLMTLRVCDIDHVDHVRHLRGDVHALAVGRDLHAFGLFADLDGPIAFLAAMSKKPSSASSSLET